MNKIYVKPSCTAIDVDAQQIICESNDSLGYSDDENAFHSGNSDDDVLVKGQSCWETEW